MTCSCVIAMSGFEPSHIEFCPLHKAAPALLESLMKLRAAAERGDADWAMNCLKFGLSDETRKAIAEGAQS